MGKSMKGPGVSSRASQESTYPRLKCQRLWRHSQSSKNIGTLAWWLLWQMIKAVHSTSSCSNCFVSRASVTKSKSQEHGFSQKHGKGYLFIYLFKKNCFFHFVCLFACCVMVSFGDRFSHVYDLSASFPGVFGQLGSDISLEAIPSLRRTLLKPAGFLNSNKQKARSHLVLSQSTTGRMSTYRQMPSTPPLPTHTRSWL